MNFFEQAANLVDNPEVASHIMTSVSSCLNKDLSSLNSDMEPLMLNEVSSRDGFKLRFSIFSLIEFCFL